MHHRLLWTAITALLVAPVALATTPATLTIYHADNAALFTGNTGTTLDTGHALVHEQRNLDVAAGNHKLRIGNLPATLDPEAIAVTFGAGVSVLGQRVTLANASTGGALNSAIGSPVSIADSMSGNTMTTASIQGVLVGASSDGLLIRTADGKVHLIHQYTSMTLPEAAINGGSSLLLDVDAKTSGQRDARITYMTSGLGWRAAYSATLASGSGCRMQFKPEASIANRSGHDYAGATITLVAGQPNLGNRGVRMYSMAAAPVPMAAAERVLPKQAALGDYRSFTLPGRVNLPKGSVTLTPLYAPRTLDCTREYVVEDGSTYTPPRPNINDYGAQDYRDRPIASTLAFTAPAALPAGTLRAWLPNATTGPVLLGEGAVADTPKGQRVAVQLGQSFNLRVSRERTAFNVDAKAHTLNEAYKLMLTNGGDSARTITVREHPDRWHTWTLTQSSSKPAQQTPQLLEFKVSVPAHGAATLTYAVRYNWAAKDL